MNFHISLKSSPITPKYPYIQALKTHHQSVQISYRFCLNHFANFFDNRFRLNNKKQGTNKFPLTIRCKLNYMCLMICIRKL